MQFTRRKLRHTSDWPAKYVTNLITMLRETGKCESKISIVNAACNILIVNVHNY
jgi:hypothetical protein